SYKRKTPAAIILAHVSQAVKRFAFFFEKLPPICPVRLFFSEPAAEPLLCLPLPGEQPLPRFRNDPRFREFPVLPAARKGKPPVPHPADPGGRLLSFPHSRGLHRPPASFPPVRPP